MTADDPNQNPRGAAVAAEIAAADEEWDRLERAGFLLISLARREKDQRVPEEFGQATDQIDIAVDDS